MRSTIDRESLELFCGRGVREATSDPFVEGGANFVDFVGLLDTDLAYEHAAILFQPHQARFLERAKRLAHGTARDAEEIRHRGFVQLGAGGRSPARIMRSSSFCMLVR